MMPPRPSLRFAHPAFIAGAPVVRLGDWWNPIDDVESVATGLWDLASQGATSLAQVATAIGGAFADVSSSVWTVAKAAAGFVGGLPGINVFVKVLDDATHLLAVILDSPITAICVVALAALLNVVGLGGPLLAEYAALRLGMDLLVKLEDGDAFTVLDFAKAVLLAASTATGLPLGAALPAEQVIQKVASGGSITPYDIQALTIAAATVSAGASGDPGAMATVSGVAAASNVVAAGIKASDAQAQMPPTLTPDGATKLPGPVVRHLVKKAPGAAAKAGQNDKLVQGVQDAQSALVAAARFQTYVAKDYGGPNPAIDPNGAFLTALWGEMQWQAEGLAPTPDGEATLHHYEALANAPIFDAPGPNASESALMAAYTAALAAAERQRIALLSPGAPLSTSTLEVLHYLQNRVHITPFDPPDPRTASKVPVQMTVLSMSRGHVVSAPVDASARSVSPNAVPSAVPNSQNSTGTPLLIRSKSPYPPIGLPEAPPAYHAPTPLPGPTVPARDIGL